MYSDVVRVLTSQCRLQLKVFWPDVVTRCTGSQIMCVCRWLPPSRMLPSPYALMMHTHMQSPSVEQQREEEERERRRRAFVYDPTLPLSREAQEKAVVVDNHNLNNVKVREHIIKLFEEQKRGRLERENNTDDRQGREGRTTSVSGDADERTHSRYDKQKVDTYRRGGGIVESFLDSLRDENLFEHVYTYRRAIFVFLGALVAFAWRRFST